MGQAKRRGSFEERKQAAIERDEADRLERERKRAERWANMTPAQKDAEKARMASVATLLGIAASASSDNMLLPFGASPEDFINRVMRDG